MGRQLPQRLRKRTRRRGQVPRSAVLTACGALVGAAAVVGVAGGGLLAFATAMVRRGISLAVHPGSLAMMETAEGGGARPMLMAAVGDALWNGALLLLPLVAAAMLGAVSATLAQGPVWAPSAVTPDPSRLALRVGSGGGGAVRAALGSMGLVLIAVVAVLAALRWSGRGLPLSAPALWARLAGALGAPVLLALVFGVGAGLLELRLARQRVDRELAEAARSMPRSALDEGEGPTRAVRTALARLRR